MKAKIVGILICIMLLTTFFSIAKNVEDEQVEHYLENNETGSSLYDDDVPVWEIGNIWTYKIDDINLDLSNENLSENFTIHLHGRIDSLPLEVVDDTGDSYQIAFQATIVGDFFVNVDLGDGPINITGELQDTTIEGYIFFNKSDLGIKQMEIIISGKLTVNVKEHPYGNWSFFPEIAVSATITADAEFDPIYPIIDFPLNTSKFWGLPEVNITFDGTIESIWLKIFNILNKIIRLPGIIELIAALTNTDPDMFHQISDILADILPVIDIGYVLNEYLGVENVIHLPEIPIIFMCNSTENITVPAGTFNAYNISVVGGLGSIYYAPEVKNVIKITGNFEDVLPFIRDINAELISYEI